MTTVNNRKVSSPSGKDEHPKQKGFLNRPRRWLGGKTIWDWLQLLIIPAVLAAGAIGFSFKQNNTTLDSI